jgi:hypothetical protein
VTEHTPALGVALTLREAAERCTPKVSRRTLVRRLEADAFPNAYRGTGSQGAGSGPWLIPVADLQAAGYDVRAEADPAAPSQAKRIEQLEQANATLQLMVGTLEEKLELTQQLAAERGAERDRLAKLLELGPGDQQHLPGTTEPVRAPSSTEPVRVSERAAWWRRLRR